jgi:pilus assembly protein FimV
MWIKRGLLTLVIAAPLCVQAAGLGRLSVISALGQPLSAEIELVSLQPGELEALNARLANLEAFRDAKIDFSPAVRLIRFNVEKRANGQPIIKISSIAPINEPFLDVLVELTWPAGRLLREYPILLDPPGFNEAKISAPVVTAPPAPFVAPLAAVKPVESATPEVSPVPMAAVPVAAAVPSDTYGPVRKGDTLNKIATQVKPDTVSLEQMLVALYRENQNAFISGNMNLLKTGQILRVPATPDMEKISQTEARKEIQVQVENWKSYRDTLASAAASGAARPESSNQAAGKIVSARPDKPGPEAGSKDILKLTKVESGAAKTGGAGAKGGSAQDQLNALKEEAIVRENALKEANSRVAVLEKQIQDMRKLLELKGVTPPPAKPVEALKPAETKIAQAPAPKPVEQPPKPPEVVKPAEPAKVEAAKPEEAKAAGKPADIKPAVPKAAAKAPPPAPEPDLMAMVMDNLPLIGGGVAVVGVLGLVGFMLVKRRKDKESGTSLTRASSVLPSDLKPNTTTGKSAGGLIDTGNSSFLTDFDKVAPGAIDTDEVDPVAEAEVYIAYGRDAQAEEILKEAMARDKSRHEIALKLLEIYHSRKSAPAFENLAKEFKETVGESNPLWAKAATMGAQIDPNNPLYAGFGLDISSTGLASTSPSEAGAAAHPNLDFDLGFDSQQASRASVDMPLDVKSTSPEISFDLDLGSEQQTPAAQPAAAGLDFNIGLDETPAAASATAAAKPAFDFDLSELSSGKPATPAAHVKTASMNLGDISLDLDSQPAPPSTMEGDAGSAVATKLELAKAYAEIGDKDGAREILQEVLKEGNASQQDEAKTLMASL